jgi:hypothetical protein
VKISRSLEFDFNKLNTFEFLQRFDSEHDSSAPFHNHDNLGFIDNKHPAFIGNILIWTGTEDQVRDIVMNATCTASNDFLAKQISYDTTCSSLSITLPSLHGDTSHSGCYNLDISLFFRPNITMGGLKISSDLSNVKVMPGVDFIVLGQTEIDLRGGSVTANPLFASRKTYIDVNAGSVHGEYGLYDLLSISTKAGSIHVDVVPKSIDVDKPAPAELLASALAGSIDITFPPANTTIPERDYYTTIKAQEGSIRGNYIHGKNTALSTNAGSIVAKLLPFFNEDSANSKISTLSTTTDAGKQDIEVLSPYNNTGISIKQMASQHLTAFASLRLKYPSEWEGFIDGKTTVGSLELDGSDLRIIEEGSIGVVGHYVKAERGDGDNELTFRSGAGSAKVLVG